MLLAWLTCNKTLRKETTQPINDAAQAYKGIIPSDRYYEPYMTMEELLHEMSDGVIFSGFEENGELNFYIKNGSHLFLMKKKRNCYEGFGMYRKGKSTHLSF